MPTIHNLCGAMIHWTKRPNGNNAPPLEQVGSAFVIDAKNVSHEVMTYRLHHCKPKDVDEWQTQMEENRADVLTKIGEKAEADQIHALRREQARERRELMTNYLDALRAWQWEVSLKRDCPKCGVKKRSKCVNLNDVRKGEKPRLIRAPHAERIPANAAGRPEPEWLEDQPKPE